MVPFRASGLLSAVVLLALPVVPGQADPEEVRFDGAQEDGAGEDGARARVEAAGGRVSPLAAGSPLLEVDFHLAGREAGDDDLRDLAAVGRVARLHLGGTKVTDQGLVHVGALEALQRLDLSRTAIQGPGLAHLRGLRQLEVLNLYGTQVDDDSLRHLDVLPALRRVFLWQSRVTPEGAGRLLVANPELRISLGADITVAPPLPAHEFTAARTAAARALLAEAGVSVQLLAQDEDACRVDFHLRPEAVDAGTLAALVELPELVEVHLGATRVTDDDLALLGRIASLEVLHLPDTAITDDGLAHLGRLRQLRLLNLHSTSVTDAGLRHLRALPSLERLFLWNTAVSAEGATQLAALRPGLRVQQGWDPDRPPAGEEPTPAARREPSCCDKAEAAGAECQHPCCVAARAQGKRCEKCNPPGDR